MNSKQMEKCTKWATVSGIVGAKETAVKIRYSRLKLLAEENAQNKTTIFLCIPGNPGNDRFYVDFGAHLLRAYSLGHNSPHSLEFLSIGHANHVPQIDNSAAEGSRRFDLDEQCAIKAEFCRQILGQIAAEWGGRIGRIYLIGHSIGAMIGMRILPELLEAGWNICTCFCLFPTVEQMADTPNGKWMGPVVKAVDHFDWFFRPFFALLNFLPPKFKEWLARRILGPGVPECVIGAVGELANSLVARNMAHMANHELHVVLDFDDSLLSKESIRERLVFFYGHSDKWAPLEFADKMRRRLPETGRVLVDSREGADGFEHAFVLRHSREMAELLVEIMLERA